MSVHTSKKQSYRFAKKSGILLLDLDETQAKVICNSKPDPKSMIELRRYLDVPIDIEQVDDNAFTEMVTKKYESESGVAMTVAEDIGEELGLGDLLGELPKTADLLESEDDAPIIRLLNALFSEAINLKSSDIHLEPFEDQFMIRLRIDGVLRNLLELPRVISTLVVSRIKVMAKLDIAEKRLPQDGRIALRIAGRNVDVRVSTIPTNHGERVVMRLLDKKTEKLMLGELGMCDDMLEKMRALILSPHGIILVTGPTGSGKTTTLYAALTQLNTADRNILTVEDPIEYDLAGVGQMQVNGKIEMTFAKGLRAMLRQDPDVVMVGEIRDLETAAIAVQASLTGHLVLSTLHTNTAAGAITRLRDMGVESFLLSSSLIGIIAQRLVRILCENCKESYQATAQECALLNADYQSPPTLHKAVGCDKCNDTGFSGRTGIYELLLIDDRLTQMIHEDEGEQDIVKYVRQHSPSIRQDGWQRVLQGDTTIDEVVRVTSA